MATQPASHPRARDDVLFRQVDDEWVVFDPAADQLHVLNLSAALIWSHLSGEHTPEDIAAVLEEEYGIEARQARADVGAALQRFQAAGLLAGGSEPAP
jgi:PqqD family protein of HPr-rel-A system